MKINKPSKIQMDLIQKKLDNIATFGIELTFEVPVLSDLTGGKDGTASQFIEFLINFERDNYDKALPTEKQLQRLCEYYLCEEVAFEEYNVKRRVALGDGLWRKLTVEEFVAELNNRLNRREASTIIEKYAPIHLAWKQKRATIEQRKYIMELQERMAYRYKPRVIETGVTFEGETFEFTTDIHETGSKEYAPLTELELYMLSQDQATHLITILKKESQDTELYSYGEVNDGSATFEKLRVERDRYGELKTEEDEVADFIFKLEAIHGYTFDELRTISDNTEKFKEMFKEIITNALLEDIITSEELMNLASKSKTVMSLIVG
jgi:predicted component of type VI protein secretion system